MDWKGLGAVASYSSSTFVLEGWTIGAEGSITSMLCRTLAIWVSGSVAWLSAGDRSGDEGRLPVLLFPPLTLFVTLLFEKTISISRCSLPTLFALESVDPSLCTRDCLPWAAFLGRLSWR